MAAKFASRTSANIMLHDVEREGEAGAFILSLKSNKRIAAPGSGNGDLSSPNPERGP
jgi:hypothetical protein